MAGIPDGSYALFRSDENKVELITDIVGSRTIWYVQTEDAFIASTSQRAIVFFLQDFQPNEEAFSWMLSSGTLGPGLSWDKRIHSLEGNARLILDRSSWETEIKKEKVIYEPVDLPDEEHEIRLKKAMEETFDNLSIDFSKWILPLSGGFDSRAILLMLKNRQGLKAVTWGLESSLRDKRNDAYVARALAKHYYIDHCYFHTDISDEPIEKIFRRFLVAGEGRIDHISGYMDGFRIWKQLYESGYQGIIRGDEAFGCKTVSTPNEVYINMGLTVFSDYEHTPLASKLINKHYQARPLSFEKQDNETLGSWRDRINAEFEIPVRFAALSDLKLPYIEVINPLLSRRIIEQVRRLPDHLRTDKKLLRRIVGSLSPPIVFADMPAIASYVDILKTRRIVDLLHKGLDSENARTLLSDELVECILDNVKVVDVEPGKVRKSLKAFVKPYIPASLKKKMGRRPAKPAMDSNVIAFRSYIICRMNRLLREDARAARHGCLK